MSEAPEAGLGVFAASRPAAIYMQGINPTDDLILGVSLMKVKERFSIVSQNFKKNTSGGQV